MAHGYDIALADEEMRLAEGDASLHQLSGARDDEQRVAILLHFRPLVRAAGVLDGQVMQAELVLHALQKIVGRLEQADPDHMARPARPFTSLLDGDIRDPASARIGARRDDAVLGALVHLSGALGHEIHSDSLHPLIPLGKSETAERCSR